MPLKHHTETTLVALLGFAMLCAGATVAVFSHVSSPWLLWIAALFISLAYPLVLYPHFRERRADYEFRLLHFVPALFLVVWMVLTVSSSVHPALSGIRAALTVAWALPLVAVGFALLAWFCVHVLRQWPRRLTTLASLLVPFAVFGILGDHFEWNRQMAAVLEIPTGSGSVSSVPVAVASARSGIAVMSRGMSSSSRGAVIADNPPPHLPHAGGGIEFFALMVPAATSAAVHLRAMRRNRTA